MEVYLGLAQRRDIVLAQLPFLYLHRPSQPDAMGILKKGGGVGGGVVMEGKEFKTVNEPSFVE